MRHGGQAMVLCYNDPISQHYKTFGKNGFFGINIALLNRFDNAGEKKNTVKQKRRNGCIIGHAFCQKLNAAILAFLWWMKSSGSALQKKIKSWSKLDPYSFGDTFPVHPYESYRCAGYGGDTRPPANRHAIQT
ncbi:MAG: hypothetical protein ACLUIQ_01740 [Dialister invisus]